MAADLSEVSKEIRRAVDTGKAAFGFKQAEKTLLTKTAEVVIFSNNTKKAEKERIQEFATLAGIKCFVFEGNGLELGAVCGKPFVVSFLTITDSGKSKLAEAIQNSETGVSEKAAMAEEKSEKKRAKKKTDKAKRAEKAASATEAEEKKEE